MVATVVGLLLRRQKLSDGRPEVLRGLSFLFPHTPQAHERKGIKEAIGTQAMKQRGWSLLQEAKRHGRKEIVLFVVPVGSSPAFLRRKKLLNSTNNGLFPQGFDPLILCVC